MLGPLPPLDMLRFFEAAARQLNSRAAEEMHVTHGAVANASNDRKSIWAVLLGHHLLSSSRHRALPLASARLLSQEDRKSTHWCQGGRGTLLAREAAHLI